MNDFLTVLIGVTVAAFVGGATNYLAIKMLFHPRKPVYLWGRKLPFSPGLIPKRKQEISKSLGKVVSDYLVTTEGLNAHLHKPEFVLKVETKLMREIERLSSSTDTLEELALRYWSREQVDNFRNQLVLWLREKSREGIRAYWEAQGLSAKKIGDLIPKEKGDYRTDLVLKSTDFIIGQLKSELESPGAEQLIRKMTVQMMDQAGGFLGTLAGVFMDEEKVAGKVRAALYRQLDSPSVRESLSGFISRKLDQAEELTLEQVIGFFSEQEAKEWISGYADNLLPWEEWIRKAGEWTLADLLAPRKEWLQAKVPAASAKVLSLVSSRMDRLINVIDLPVLVEEQVNNFPVERLEQIILSVSGKELRAITWLGAILGSFIGLFQAMLMLWTR